MSKQSSHLLPYLSEDLKDAIADFELPERMGFGRVFAPVMYRASFTGGSWENGNLSCYGPIRIMPGAKVLHYAQEVFEGQKAYCKEGTEPTLFRPNMNFRRFNRSANRLGLPEVPEEVYFQGIFGVTALNRDFIPSGSGESLYLRPFMIGTENDLGMSSSTEAEFMVIASPSEAYHIGSISVFIERTESRVASGAIGAAKVGGNYASALKSAARCKDFGYDLSLWLDPETQKNIDELSGMNFFAVVDGELLTPRLTGSILPGITRDSILRLAESMGIRVCEESISLERLLELIVDGRCTECFACGTAAIVAPIREFGEEDGTHFVLPDIEDSITMRLREKLLSLQEGGPGDLFGWNQPLPFEFQCLGQI